MAGHLIQRKSGFYIYMCVCVCVYVYIYIYGSLRSGTEGIVLQDCGESDDRLTFLILSRAALALT
jgi:hypothetical protein